MSRLSQAPERKEQKGRRRSGAQPSPELKEASAEPGEQQDEKSKQLKAVQMTLAATIIQNNLRQFVNEQKRFVPLPVSVLDSLTALRQDDAESVSDVVLRLLRFYTAAHGH